METQTETSPLEAFLTEIDAVKIKEATLDTYGGGSIALYAAGSKTFCVRRFGLGGGFDIYIEAEDSLRIDKTFDAVRAYIAR